MIQKLQNFFHTDKWWGKSIFILVLYVLYWFLFYVVLFLLFGSISESNIGGFFFIFYIVIIIPVSSFLVPKIIRKTFYIKKSFLYTFHVLLIALSLFLYIWLIVHTALSNYNFF